MRQASWEEMWRTGEQAQVEEKPPWWSKLAIFSWEELITMVIVLIAFITIVQSINSADWVPEMPSLFSIAFVGLGTGLILSRVRVNELLLHVVALAAGAAATLHYATAASLEGSFGARSSEGIERIQVWTQALLGGGISNDNLPFVVVVVGATFLTAYMSAWSIFRWYNAWLGLIPPGLALLTNISYLPGQGNLPLLIYLFCAILLVARVNVLRAARDWRRSETAYPDMISLHVLNVTIWVALALLAAAWVMPVGNGSGLLFSVWEKATAPIAGPFQELGRVFSSIDSKTGGTVHRFGSTLPLQGEISLGGGEVMQVTANETGFLRAQSYDFYTAQGWKIGTGAQITTTPWQALRGIQSPEEARRQFRRPVSIEVTTTKRASVIVSAGQPLSVNVDSRLVFGAEQADVTSIRPTDRLNEGAQYRVDSTVSNATVQRLRDAPGAASDYPAWTAPYLQLPNDLPRSVRNKAREVAPAGSAYDRAVQIEQFLRTYAVDTKIDPAPPRRDSVEYFLFTLYRGYFDYHSSAMVVMLRSLGIPSRMAVGYIIRPQDRVPDTSTYIVNEANAFAWPEVYFPGLGWVEFNPTPNEPRVLRSGTDDQSFNDTFNDDEFLEDEFLDDLGTVPVDPAIGALDQLEVEEEQGIVGRIIVLMLVGVVAVTALVGGTFQYALSRGLGGLAYPVQVWEKSMRLARWARIRPRPQETPRDIVARLRRDLPDVSDLDYLGESFQRSRYGAKDFEAEDRERLRSVWNDLRKTLLQRMLRWK